jgi:hypothetical protein
MWPSAKSCTIKAQDSSTHPWQLEGFKHTAIQKASSVPIIDAESQEVNNHDTGFKHISVEQDSSAQTRHRIQAHIRGTDFKHTAMPQDERKLIIHMHGEDPGTRARQESAQAQDTSGSGSAGFIKPWTTWSKRKSTRQVLVKRKSFSAPGATSWSQDLTCNTGSDRCFIWETSSRGTRPRVTQKSATRIWFSDTFSWDVVTKLNADGIFEPRNVQLMRCIFIINFLKHDMKVKSSWRWSIGHGPSIFDLKNIIFMYNLEYYIRITEECMHAGGVEKTNSY